MIGTLGGRLRASRNGKRRYFSLLAKNLLSVPRISRRFLAIRYVGSIHLRTSLNGIQTMNWASPGNHLIPVVFIRPCTAGGFGPCANSQDLARPKTQTSAFVICFLKDRQVFPWRSICQL